MSTEIKPLSPSDINLKDRIPSYVIEAVNNLIKKYYIGKEFTINQDELISEIRKCSTNGIGRQTIFDNKYLDIVQLYNENGWLVVYVTPDSYESFESFFKFTPKKY